MNKDFCGVNEPSEVELLLGVAFNIQMMILLFL